MHSAQHWDTRRGNAAWNTATVFPSFMLGIEKKNHTACISTNYMIIKIEIAIAIAHTFVCSDKHALIPGKHKCLKNHTFFYVWEISFKAFFFSLSLSLSLLIFSKTCSDTGFKKIAFENYLMYSVYVFRENHQLRIIMWTTYKLSWFMWFM